MTIFRTEAPKYWQRGLPAIPLIERQKRPAIRAWQEFADRMPSEEERDIWLANFPDGNIGLPLGISSGLIAVDIDTEDPHLLEVIKNTLPLSPWTRVGKKGEVRVYRFNGERTTRISDSNNNMILEILSKGSQIALSPSIHPDTGRPYTSNCELHALDMEKIPALPSDILQQLREGLRAAGVEFSSGAGAGGFTGFVPAGNRDNKMVWMAGIFARDVVRGNKSLLECLGELTTWVENFTEKVVGDDLCPKKACAKLVEFLLRDLASNEHSALPVGWDEGLTADMKADLGVEIADENVSWTAPQITQRFLDDINSSANANPEGVRQVIENALIRMTRNQQLTALERNDILKLIQKESGEAHKISVLKHRLKELEESKIDGINHTEIAELLRSNLLRYGDVRWDSETFWQWKGSHWEELSIAVVERTIATEFGHLPAAKKQNDHQQICKVLRTLLLGSIGSTDCPPGINFANGFLTEDLELIDHHPDQGMTYVLPFRYLPEMEGHMPLFRQFLDDCWGSDPDALEKVDALQEAIGVTLFGQGPTYQRAMLLIGKAKSGKTTLTSLIGRLLPPESTSNVPPHKWNDRFLPARMNNKICNFAGELSETKSIPGDIFKQIVGGEATDVQFKNKDPFKMIPKATHWFCSNHYPKTKDVSAGFSRRWLALKFNHVVPAQKRILNLEKLILESEAEAIVAWSVQGYLRVREQGDYTLPPSHQTTIAKMNTRNSSLTYYLAEAPGLKVGHENTDRSTRADEVWRDYTSCMISSGIRDRLSFQEFQIQMEDLADQFNFECTLEDGDVFYRNLELDLKR